MTPALGLCAFLAAAASAERPFLNGADANYWLYLSSTIYDSPAWAKRVWPKPAPWRWTDGGTPVASIPAWLKERGVGAVRVRVWVGDDGPHGLDYAAEVARRARDAGLKIHLVLFLSDQWADVAKQPRPAAWKRLNGAGLLRAVRTHGHRVAGRLRRMNVPVDLYAIGNEVDFGVCGAFPPTIKDLPERARLAAWREAAEILKAAAAGVREADPQARFVHHLGLTFVEPFVLGHLAWMAAAGVAFDAVGLSYYPSSGPMAGMRKLAQFAGFVEQVRAATGKPVLVSEYAFPHASACPGAIFPEWCGPALGFEPSPDGQAKMVETFLTWARTAPGVLGAFYWSPEFHAPGLPNATETGWGPMALFGPDGAALPASRALLAGAGD